MTTRAREYGCFPWWNPTGGPTARQIVLYGLALIPVSLAPSLLGMAGRLYLAGALLLGLWFLYSGYPGLRSTAPRCALGAVLIVSVLYLPLI